MNEALSCQEYWLSGFGWSLCVHYGLWPRHGMFGTWYMSCHAWWSLWRVLFFFQSTLIYQAQIKTNNHPKWVLVKKVMHALSVSTVSQWIQHIPTGAHPTNTTWGRAYFRTSIPCPQFNVWLFWGLRWLFLFSVSLVSQKLICPLYRIAHLK